MSLRPVPNAAGFVESVLAAADLQDRAKRQAYERLIARAPDHSPQAVRRTSRRNTPGPQARYNLTEYELLVFNDLVRQGRSQDAAAAAIVRGRSDESTGGAR